MIARKRLTMWGAGAVTTLAVTACSGSADDNKTKANAAHEFGWSHPVATYNTYLPVDVRLGIAAVPIEGHSLGAIVTDPAVRVRGDDHACVDCHAWAKTMDRTTFCASHVDDFEAQPTTTGSGDPVNAKPAILKQLLADWKARGCPE